MYRGRTVEITIWPLVNVLSDKSVLLNCNFCSTGVWHWHEYVLDFLVLYSHNIQIFYENYLAILYLIISILFFCLSVRVFLGHSESTGIPFGKSGFLALGSF